ncbi:DNA-binding protein [Trinickia mobilis]|uniref:DNA-binding protein n=1 Tax=Trinickia mobilis TaxID=2816356 RepID=UPI001A8D102D|nr:DNA-binding protein [Trinickia mobilis]
MTLEADIDAVRERVADTQALYREVCALMFFRYGETPTANKLYQLVRKGSMSAPAKALRDFWTEVREKSRVDVGQPDLPAEVAHAAGELVARLWRLSADAAGGALEAFRQEAQLEVDAARERASEAEARHASALITIRAAGEKAAADAARIAQLEAELLQQQTAQTLLREQLAGARAETNATTEALADARRDFAAELEKLRQSLSQNEERLAAAEKRALLEIDNERAASGRARKELQLATDRINQLESAHRAERDALRDTVARLTAQQGALERERAGLEAQLSAKDAFLAELGREAESLRHRLAVSDEKAASARPGAVSRRSALPSPVSSARRQRRELKLSDDVFRRRVRAVD